MIVGVKPWPEANYFEYFEIQSDNEDSARKIAFRYQRKIKDNSVSYNDLVHQTTIVRYQRISSEISEFLR